MLHREANELDEQVDRRWPTDGELQAAVGDVWAALGDTGTAIERYEHAVAAATSTAPLRSLELLANLCSRRGLELHRACDVAGLPDTEVDGFLDKAERWTTVLQKIGLDTAERCALNAGHYKRLAILRPIRRTEDLRNAIDAYVAALKVDAGYIYCFRNAMQLAAIQGGEVSPSLETLLADAELIGRWASDATQPLSDAEFWLRVGYADSRLTAALIDPHQQLGEELVDRLRALGDDDASRAAAALIESDLSSQIDDLAIAYGNARAGGFMQLGWHSIVEHVTDLEELARTADLAVAPALRHLTDRLARIDV